jgi:ketosteroid isomerase-like protein
VTQAEETQVGADLESRLRRLEDIIEIQQLFIAYGYHLDRGEFAAYAGLFAEDGEFAMGPIGRAKGRAEIEAVMARTFGPGVGSLVHVITNPVIDLDGDRATSDVMWTVVSRGPDGNPVLSMLGRHRDDLIREGGRWRFQKRRGLIDIPSALPQ